MAATSADQPRNLTSRSMLAGQAAAAASEVESALSLTPDPTTAAFFDVDNTVMQGASIFHLARGLHRRKFFTTGDIVKAADAVSQLANEVIIVPDGEAALDYLQRAGAYAQRAEGNPAVVLLELKLPKVNGLEVLQTVRATEHLRSVPVVIHRHASAAWTTRQPVGPSEGRKQAR